MRSDGVPEFTNLYLQVNMPKGKEACKYCPAIKFDNDSNTRRCKLTWEFLTYPDTTVGELCMLLKKSDLIKEDK